MSEARPLHRLFGLSWIDFLQDTPIGVETELDLSVKQQFIDVILIRKGPGPLPRRLPDGFEDLAAHNLLTFKSHQEALDAWTLWELVGHFVNYRKQASPSLQDLLPEDDFRLFAVCVRYPQNLAQRVVLTPVRDGVYEVQGLGLRIRLIVVHQLPLAEQNAMLHLFSAREEFLRYGREHYRPHSRDTSTLLYELFKAYSEEPDMPDKLKDFVRQSIDELWPACPRRNDLRGFPRRNASRGCLWMRWSRPFPLKPWTHSPEGSNPTVSRQSHHERAEGLAHCASCTSSPASLPATAGRVPPSFPCARR